MKNAIRAFSITTMTLVSSLSLTTPADAQDHAKSGFTLFQEHCAACHIGDKKFSERLAPPVFAVKSHYLPTYRSKEDFSNAVVRWVKTPSKDYSLMPGAQMRFGLMPAIDMDEKEIRTIAEFIYDSKFDIPGWYAEHYREEHGKDPEAEQ